MAVPENIFEALGAASIRGVKSTRPKHTEKVRCPKCEGGRTAELSLSVTIDDDGMGFAALCHRGSCQWKHGARIRHPASKVYKRPHASPPKLDILRPDWFYEFFSERRIGSRTVHHFGCYATKHYFNNSFGGDHPAIVFPYLFGGELVNRKYRPKGHKSPQAQEPDAEPTLFNVDALGDAPEEIVWVEGEPDVMAMFECGISHAVTLKDGAGKTVRAVVNEDDKRFEALRTHSDILAKAGRIILAGDHDVSGFAMREELARRLGRHRCYVVTWPDGCKDACDVLRAHGPDAVLQAVANAEPFPIDGLQRITEGTLAALWSRPAPKTMTTGTLASDRILKLPQEGRLIIVTGVPSHGKTSWTRFVMVHTATEHRRKWVVFSPEHQPWESFVAEVAEVYCGKPFYPNPVIERMSLEEIAGAERWLSDHVTMMVCDAEDEAPTLSWILERARASVLRDGSTDLLIDPWNEVEHQRGDMSETDYIGRCLQRLKAFGLRHGCNVWIIAHPAKPQILKHGEKRAAPGPYDLSGCYSSDTEVLTKRGWVAHSDISLDDNVCCFDLNGESLVYCKPTHLHEYDHDGVMHHYTGYSLDLMVTPAHRMVLQAAWKRPGKKDGNERLGRPDTWSHGGWQFAESQDLRHAKYYMPMAAPLAGDVGESFDYIPQTDDQLAAWAFVGWYVSEGWDSGGSPAICQRESAMAEPLAAISGLGLMFSQAIGQSKRLHELPMWRARIKRRTAGTFCDWIFENCGKGALNKKLPAAVWGLDGATKMVLFDALISGDGRRRANDPTRMRQGGCTYSTISQQLADDVQRLAIELGLYATVSCLPGVKSHHFARYTVEIGHPDRGKRVIVLPRQRRDVGYSGKVYCLTVPTGAYITRRNGMMAICGNSAHWANKSDLGITLFSPENGVAEVHVWKTRFRRWGKRGSVATLEFDELNSRYKTPVMEIGAEPAVPSWMDEQ